MSFSKRGQTIFSNILIGIILLFVVAVGIVAAVNWNGPSSISSSFGTVSNVVMEIVRPLFNFLLNLSALPDDNIRFLVVLAFIMVSIVIIGTLDSMNIFGEGKNSHLINFFVGIIVSLIGVRFMPPNMWSSLTATSSAFVATLLVGVPFLALGFVSMKVKFNLARKAIWLFYLVVLGYLISFGQMVWVYVIFAVLAGVMMFFDKEVRKYIYAEKAKADIESMLSKMTLKEKKILRDEIRSYQAIVDDPNSPPRDKSDAKDILKDLEKQYGDISRI